MHSFLKQKKNTFFRYNLNERRYLYIDGASKTQINEYNVTCFNDVGSRKLDENNRLKNGKQYDNFRDFSILL